MAIKRLILKYNLFWKSLDTGKKDQNIGHDRKYFHFLTKILQSEIYRPNQTTQS